ncbi:MAG: hypothetical protein GXP50_02290 [Deltaproteobacteria bacterium]|nr:hypothetical protein [Deltaproteobacteria bacterium]
MVGPRQPARRMRLGLVGQAVLLMVLWLVLSGLYDPFHLGLGAVSVACVLWLNRRLPRPAGRGRTEVHVLRFAAYCGWLLGQILLSALHVAGVVLHPRLPVSPRMVRFRSDQPNDVARMLLANSITLTPGTLTVEVDGDEFTVHALTEATARGLLDGTMQAKVARLFSDEPGRAVYDVRWEEG